MSVLIWNTEEIENYQYDTKSLVYSEINTTIKQG